MTLTEEQTGKLTEMVSAAEKANIAVRNKLWKAEAAVKAAQWLAEHGDPKKLVIATHTASGCSGYKEAMTYLNDLFQTFAADMMMSALENAGADMDAILNEPK